MNKTIDELFEKHFLSIIDGYKIYHSPLFKECRYYISDVYFLYYDINLNRVIINAQELFHFFYKGFSLSKKEIYNKLKFLIEKYLNIKTDKIYIEDGFNMFIKKVLVHPDLQN
jgi:hypothetical protein